MRTPARWDRIEPWLRSRLTGERHVVEMALRLCEHLCDDPHLGKATPFANVPKLLAELAKVPTPDAAPSEAGRLLGILTPIVRGGLELDLAISIVEVAASAEPPTAPRAMFNIQPEPSSADVVMEEMMRLAGIEPKKPKTPQPLSSDSISLAEALVSTPIPVKISDSEISFASRQVAQKLIDNPSPLPVEQELSLTSEQIVRALIESPVPLKGDRDLSVNSRNIAEMLVNQPAPPKEEKQLSLGSKQIAQQLVDRPEAPKPADKEISATSRKVAEELVARPELQDSDPELSIGSATIARRLVDQPEVPPKEISETSRKVAEGLIDHPEAPEESPELSVGSENVARKLVDHPDPVDLPPKEISATSQKVAEGLVSNPTPAAEPDFAMPGLFGSGGSDEDLMASLLAEISPRTSVKKETPAPAVAPWPVIDLGDPTSTPTPLPVVRPSADADLMASLLAESGVQRVAPVTEAETSPRPSQREAAPTTDTPGPAAKRRGMSTAEHRDAALRIQREMAELMTVLFASPGDEVRLNSFAKRLATLDRSLWRLGFKTFRSLAESFESVFGALAGSRFAPPRELLDMMQRTVDLAGAMLRGEQSQRRTYYDHIERLNTIRVRIEEDVLREREARREERQAKSLAKPGEEDAGSSSSARRRAELPRLQQVFLREMEQHLNSMTRNLLLVERDPGNPEVIFSLMRSAHSIKGGGAVAKFTVIAKFAHAMEDLLVAIRDNALRMTATAINLTLRGVDTLQILMEEAEHGDESDPAITEGITRQFRELTEHIVANLEEFRAFPETADAVAREKFGIVITTDQQAKKKETRYVSVDLQQLDQLMNLAADLVINRTRLNAHMDLLRTTTEELTDVRRSMTTLGRRLKGAVEETLNSVNATDQRRSESGGLLGEFEAEEFDRFNRLDLWRHELRQELARFGDVCDRAATLSSEFDQLTTVVSQIANDLQESISRTRMIPIGHVFERFPRALRDLAEQLGKKVTLDIHGAETPLDKTIIEEIADPLMHILRNALDHGIELPEDRVRSGKNAAGKILLSARLTGNHVSIMVKDDGGGIDPDRLRDAAVRKGFMTSTEAEAATDQQLYDLLMRSGFSTAKEVTDVSGRGVGLDVVAERVAALKGTLALSSEPGEGTTFTLRLPITLSIAPALLFRSGGERFAIPLSAVLEVVSLNATSIFRTSGHEVLRLRESLIPLVDLNVMLDLPDQGEDERFVVVIGEPTQRTGVIVGELIGREEIVIKSLGDHLKRVPFVSGATILADGGVTLILDNMKLASTAAPARAALPELEAEARILAAPAEQRSEKIRRTEAREAKPPRQRDEEPITSPVPVPETPKEERPAPRTERRPGETRRVSTARASTQRHILVVDDSASVRTYVSGVLEGAGYRITEAHDGIDALEKLAKGYFDLILTDLEMPRMHGFELIAEVKNSAAYKHIPMVILTGRMGEKHSRKGLELGAAAFLVKPFEENELLSTIKTHLLAEGR